MATNDSMDIEPTLTPQSSGLDTIAQPQQTDIKLEPSSTTPLFSEPMDASTQPIATEEFMSTLPVSTSTLKTEPTLSTPSLPSHSVLMENPNYKTEFELKLFHLMDYHIIRTPNYMFSILNIYHALHKEGIFKPTFEELLNHLKSYYNLDILREYTEDGLDPTPEDFELLPSFNRLQKLWLEVHQKQRPREDWDNLESDDDYDDDESEVGDNAELQPKLEPPQPNL